MLGKQNQFSISVNRRTSVFVQVLIVVGTYQTKHGAFISLFSLNTFYVEVSELSSTDALRPPRDRHPMDMARYTRKTQHYSHGHILLLPQSAHTLFPLLFCKSSNNLSLWSTMVVFHQ